MKLRDFFNYENKFFYILNKVADSFLLSAMWLLFCLPVVTIGASTTALYYTVHKVLLGNRDYVFRSFWTAFRSNWKQTTKIWLALLVLLAVLVYDREFAYVNFLTQGSPLGLLYYFFSITFLLVLVWGIYIFAYAARFVMDGKNIMKNSAWMLIRHAGWSFLILLLLIASSLVVYFLSPFWLLFLPAVIGVLCERILERIFRRYMTEEDRRKEEESDRLR